MRSFNFYLILIAAFCFVHCGFAQINHTKNNFELKGSNSASITYSNKPDLFAINYTKSMNSKFNVIVYDSAFAMVNDLALEEPDMTEFIGAFLIDDSYQAAYKGFKEIYIRTYNLNSELIYESLLPLPKNQKYIGINTRGGIKIITISKNLSTINVYSYKNNKFVASSFNLERPKTIPYSLYTYLKRPKIIEFDPFYSMLKSQSKWKFFFDDNHLVLVSDYIGKLTHYWIMDLTSNDSKQFSIEHNSYVHNASYKDGLIFCASTDYDYFQFDIIEAGTAQVKSSFQFIANEDEDVAFFSTKMKIENRVLNTKQFCRKIKNNDALGVYLYPNDSANLVFNLGTFKEVNSGAGGVSGVPLTFGYSYSKTTYAAGIYNKSTTDVNHDSINSIESLIDSAPEYSTTGELIFELNNKIIYHYIDKNSNQEVFLSH